MKETLLNILAFIIPVLISSGLTASFIWLIFKLGGVWERFKKIEYTCKKLEFHVEGVEYGLTLLLLNLAKENVLELNSINESLGAIKSKIMASKNPINQEEADKLNFYYKMFTENESFTSEQASEFLRLSRKYYEDIDEAEKILDASKLMKIAAVVFGKYYKS